MRTTRYSRILVTFTALSVLAAVATVSTYSWLFFKVRGAITEVTLASEESQLLATQNAHTQTVRRIVRDTKDERAELGTHFVTEEEIVSFLEDIETLGSHAGATVQVQSVGVGKPVDKDKLITPLQLTLKAQGSLEEVFYTLTLLEVLPKALAIERVRFTQHATDFSWSGIFNMTVMKADAVKEK